MPPAAPQDTPERIRQHILDAADIRLRQFGFRKTTMAEIAQDAGMSAANLYRYFRNKEDIGAGLALRCFEEKESRLRAIVDDANTPASDRLRLFTLELVRYTHEQCSEQPLIHELVEVIATRRKDIVNRKIEGERTLLSSLLMQGIQAGEFAMEDVGNGADAVLHAIAVFSLPLTVQFFPLPQLEHMAQQVVDLILRGLLLRSVDK